MEICAKRTCRALIIILTFTFANSYIHAQSNLPSQFQSGSYLPGLVSVRDLVYPEVSGLIFSNYSVWLNSKSFIDGSGNALNSLEILPGQSVPVKTNLNAFVNAFDVTYVSPKLSFLADAQYLFFIEPTYTTGRFQVIGTTLVNNVLEINGSANGFGDLTVAPLFLSFSFKNIDVTGGYTFVVPTGRYKTGANDNVGIGFWSHIFQIGGYYYLNQKSTAIMLLPSYEITGKLKDAEVNSGDRLTLEFGMSQYFTENLELSLQVGSSWQVTKDIGDAVYWDNSVKDKLSVLGAGLGYWFFHQSLYVNSKFLTSFANRENFKASGLELQLMFLPKF